jgi:hypothetical protein
VLVCFVVVICLQVCVGMFVVLYIVFVTQLVLAYHIFLVSPCQSAGCTSAIRSV